MRERAERILRAEPGYVPVAARPASTMALLRDGRDGLEVFLMRRLRTLGFAPGMHVYPGGGVDPADSAVPVSPGTDLDAVARLLSTTDPVGIVAAAVRETFEESGVLLAVDGDGAPVTLDESWEEHRRAVTARELSFAELLVSRGLSVHGEALVPFAHWVTPETQQRRFDTRFVAARLPEGQEPSERGGESDVVRWWRPGDAVASFEAGETPMLAPTVDTLEILSAYTSVDDAIAGLRELPVRPLMPRGTLDAATDQVTWMLVDERTGEVLRGGIEPPPSEVDGVHA